MFVFILVLSRSHWWINYLGHSFRKEASRLLMPENAY